MSSCTPFKALFKTQRLLGRLKMNISGNFLIAFRLIIILISVACLSVSTFAQQERDTMSGDGKPQPLPNTCGRPHFPPLSQYNGEVGTVVLTLNIGADGVLNGATIGKSSGYKRLDSAALDSISTCRFTSSIGEFARFVDYPIHFKPAK